MNKVHNIPSIDTRFFMLVVLVMTVTACTAPGTKSTPKRMPASSEAVKAETAPAEALPKNGERPYYPAAANGATENGAAASEVIIGGTIQLLARDFILPGQPPDPAYQFYTYLFFSERSEANYARRQAAAMAFMCTFDDVGEALALDLIKGDLAVFYAPVASHSDLPRLRASRKAEDLLAVYNYSYAQMMEGRLAALGDAKALELSVIASPVPLEQITAGNIGQVQLLSLTGMPPAHVAKLISEFRRSLTQPSDYKRVQRATGRFMASGEPIIETVLLPRINGEAPLPFSSVFSRFLESIGTLVTSIVPDAHAEEQACR